jgi:3-methyladenine DNA glycosylase AlkC
VRRADDGVVYDNPGCPFVVKTVGGGAARFVRRRCNIAEHLRAVSSTSAALRLPGAKLVLKLQ